MFHKFVVEEDFRLRDGVLIQGLPGIGLVGKIAVDYIVSELKLKKVAEYYSDGLLLPVGNAGVIVDDSAVIHLPSYRFHILGLGERDLLFLSSEVQPVTWAHYEVANHVLEFFQERGGVEVVGACGTSVDEGEEPAVYFAADTEETSRWLEGLGFRKSAGGTITGACGLVPALARLRGMKGYVLMGSTRTPEPNPEAAMELIKALMKVYGFTVDLTNIEKIIAEIKKRQEEERRKLEELKESVKGKEGLPAWYV